jgi:drug/metabolite transporter (DMT)-like permease
MNTNRRQALVALCAAGLLWGTTVPLSKLALEWLPAGWLAAGRFGLAAALLLPFTRRGLRAAFTPRVLIYGAIGYGGTVIVQNAGITRTSVTHAALMIGAVPVLVAVISAVWLRAVARPVAWAGFAVSLAGVALVTGGGGGGATPRGDALVLASLLLSATFTVAQARLLPGRDPIAVTAVEFLGAALGALTFSVITEGMPGRPAGAAPVLAVLALAACGTLLPFTLFAFGQSRVSSEVAGAFLNLEPLVGALAGAAFFGDPAGPGLLFGCAAILVGIGLSTLTLLRGGGGDAADRGARGSGPGTGTVTQDAWSPLGEIGLRPTTVVRLRVADVFRPPHIVAITYGPMGATRGWNHSPFGILGSAGQIRRPHGDKWRRHGVKPVAPGFPTEWKLSGIH